MEKQLFKDNVWLMLLKWIVQLLSASKDFLNSVILLTLQIFFCDYSYQTQKMSMKEFLLGSRS